AACGLGVRPRLQPGRHEVSAARPRGGCEDHRRPGDARRSGRAAIRIVDRAAPRARPVRARRQGGLGAEIHSNFEEFVELARRSTFVPVWREIMADLLTPVSAFLKIAEHSDYAFLLESVEGGEHVGRYSFLGKDPFMVVRGRGDTVTYEQ